MTTFWDLMQRFGIPLEQVAHASIIVVDGRLIKSTFSTAMVIDGELVLPELRYQDIPAKD